MALLHGGRKIQVRLKAVSTLSHSEMRLLKLILL